MKCTKGCAVSKFHACALGVACGVTKALFLMLFAWTAAAFGYGLVFINNMGLVFQGYAPTFVGGLFGGAYGLIIGYVFGFVIGLIYNLCISCCRCGSCEKCNDKSCGCGNRNCTCNKTN